MALAIPVVELKSVVKVAGEQYVMTLGTTMMLLLHVYNLGYNLDLLQLCEKQYQQEELTLVKAVDLSTCHKFNVKEMYLDSLTVK